MTPDPKPLDLVVRDASLKRRDEQKTRLREQIFRAAAELLVEDGYAAFSLRKLAARIGYSPTTIYRYYRDKDALVLAVCDEGFSLFGQALHRAAAAETDPFAQLGAIGRAYVRFGFENPTHYRVMFMQRSDFWSAVSPDAIDAKLDSYQLLLDTVSRLIASGRTPFETAQADDVACTLWAQMHGIVTLGLTMPFIEPGDVEQMTRIALDIQGRGLAR